MKELSVDTNSSSVSSPNWNSLSGVKRKFSESVEPQNNRRNELNVIQERSNEGSESNSFNKVGTSDSNNQTAVNNQNIKKSTTWWLWSQNTNEIGDIDNAQPNQDIKNDENNRWTNWNSYRNVGSVVSYIYSNEAREDHKEQEQLQESIPNNHQPDNRDEELNSEGTLTENTIKESNTSWFSWWWSNKDDPNNDIDDENASDLYKSVKQTIENSKGTSYYAFRALKSNRKMSEVELAVSDTLTEIQPIRHFSKRRPLTPNELQEISLKAQPPNGSIKSSGSSVNSDVIHSRNYIIPQIEDNYRSITWKTKARLFGEHIIYNENTSEKHIYRNTGSNIKHKREKYIKKIVIVGVHSFLPIKMVKGLIGDSTGNSIKFVNEATSAIKEWFLTEPEDSLVEIETIALEGEGRTEERVSKLYKLLENWMQSINECDFLFFVSHSHGSVVAIHLLAELLIQHPRLAKKKVGLLSMCGMINGPYLGLDSKLVVRAYTTIENEIIAELFELQKPKSLLSTKLNRSMKILMDYGVKVSFSGAPNDQLVPLSSSLAVGFSHPNIHRFIYIHHKCDLPPFMISLLRIAVTLRNLGRTDFNLLRDLSDFCVGTISEGGHCKIFRDTQVYATAIKHTLETTRLTHYHPFQVEPVAGSKTLQNYYNLSSAARSLIHELTLTKNICNAKLAFQLIQDFKLWSPTQKQWKELKCCFEALNDASLEDFVL